MKLNKKIMISIAVIGIAAISTINVFLNENSNVTNIFLYELEAMALGSGESGAGISTQSECQQSGGYWNMALVTTDGGIETVPCEVSGEISLFGITIKRSYTRGNSYLVAWSLWSCSTSTGNCCIASSQGIRLEAY